MVNRELVHVERTGPTTVVVIDRPGVRNAVDRPTADALEAAFAAFDADEALAMGLVNRVTEPGTALDGARRLAGQLASFPQACLRSDRRSSYEQWDHDLDGAMVAETAAGIEVVRSGEALDGAARFVAGAGRHGAFE